ncbi:MAG: CDP-alcohol phosphatidyltransferase family protein [Acidimicrobiales bacterium]
MAPDFDPGGPGGRSTDHLAAWAELHGADPPTGLVAAWLRASAAVARPLVRAGVSPDTVTFASLGAALAAVGAARGRGLRAQAAGCALATASGLLDNLDGAVAVASGRAGRAGFLLDSALDRLGDAALMAAMAVAAQNTSRDSQDGKRSDFSWAAMAVTATAGAWWLEYIRARSTLAQPPDRQPVTPGERPTRIVIAAVSLALPRLAPAGLVAQVVLSVGSAAHLLGWSLRRLRQYDSDVSAALRGAERLGADRNGPRG